jgi:beta-N-acetylhexosaminidase
VYPSRDSRARRRLAVLAVAAVVAALGGAILGAGAQQGAPEPAREPARDETREAAPPAARGAARLSLRKRAGLLIVMRFAGTTVPDYVVRALRAGRSPGVILFRDNITSRGSLEQMTRRLHRAAGGTAIVATDQEGGSIRNLDWAAPATGQGATATPQVAEESARAAAADLRAVGVNMNLAPVADVALVPGSVMAGRAFPGGPDEVAAAVAAAVRGYEGTGVVPVVKHFPGIGAATANTDDVAVQLARTPEQLLAEDLPPFRAAIEAGVPLVMASHAEYPALDPEAVASQSSVVLEELLRDRLGFEGVIITDSIEAAAVSDRMPPEQATIRSIRAGVDLILTTGPGSHLRSLRAIIAEASRSPAFERRVTEAAERVLALRSRLHGPR